MKRSTIKLIITLSVWAIICLSIPVSICWFLFSFDALPEGDFLIESYSPDSNYVIKAYLCNGGATVDFAVRAELIDLINDDSKNIYWDYRISTAEILWNSSKIVVINGHEIKIPEGKYDWRNKYEDY